MNALSYSRLVNALGPVGHREIQRNCQAPERDSGLFVPRSFVVDTAASGWLAKRASACSAGTFLLSPFCCLLQVVLEFEGDELGECCFLLESCTTAASAASQLWRCILFVVLTCAGCLRLSSARPALALALMPPLPLDRTWENAGILRHRGRIQLGCSSWLTSE